MSVSTSFLTSKAVREYLMLGVLQPRGEYQEDRNAAGGAQQPQANTEPHQQSLHKEQQLYFYFRI